MSIRDFQTLFAWLASMRSEAGTRSFAGRESSLFSNTGMLGRRHGGGGRTSRGAGSIILAGPLQRRRAVEAGARQ